MSFESKIIDTCVVMERNLLSPATIAYEKPDNGVTVHNKSAYFVIRDCAKITKDCLLIYLYGTLQNPIDQLRNKFTEKEIIDFVSRSNKDVQTKQLLNLIFVDIAKDQDVAHIKVPDNDRNVVTDFSEEKSDNIYGDYDYADIVEPDDEVTIDELNLMAVDITDNRAVIDKLISVFNAELEQ